MAEQSHHECLQYGTQSTRGHSEEPGIRLSWNGVSAVEIAGLVRSEEQINIKSVKPVSVMEDWGGRRNNKKINGQMEELGTCGPKE